MTEPSYTRWREEALDRSADEAARLTAIHRLAGSDSRDAVEALLDLGNRRDEVEPILQAAGRALADLAGAGRVSEWDIRDLADATADAFFE